MIILVKVILLVSLTLSFNVNASEEILNQFFQQVDSLQARFEQEVVDEQGSVLDRSNGLFYLSRPGKFRWNYNASDFADEGQQIIADGEFIYLYDPDLEQVSRRSMQDALLQVPSLVLVRSGNELRDHFSITDFGLTDGLSWVALKPKDGDASYQELMIGFSGDELRSIVLRDGLGNQTRLQLSAVDSNAKLSSSVFKFDPPEGVDLFIE